MAKDGYAWWYVDALSDDGRHGLCIIAFIGSVFSPYYAWRRRSGPADPADFCAVNVALYGAGARRWAMTERGAAALARTRNSLAVGPSSLEWDRDALTIRFDEMAVPWPRRVRGEVRLDAQALPDREFLLDPAGRHRWRPIAPRARVSVRLSSPDLAWQGQGYFDTNDGDRPLADDFVSWDWSREAGAHGGRIVYDARRRDGGATALALGLDSAGALVDIAAPPFTRLPRTWWGLARSTRADAGADARIIQPLEDTPFYSRSVVATRWGGEQTTFVHESLSLDRFTSPVVQAMLPFRMPRQAQR
ncbi:carotenoid 1,2-hydratase [Phreatobacter sp.]|uniref:carotenoid 1,2-hydratase n=1 Tax=Phreatobacter sp. TaxID=1966341 RepID=UPI003F6F0955